MSFYYERQTITVAATGTTSTAFRMPTWVSFVGLLLPAMDNGAIGLEISIDNGATYHPVLDPADGEDLVVAASGADPGWIDVSDFIRFVPPEAFIRITCASQTSGAVTIQVHARG